MGTDDHGFAYYFFLGSTWIAIILVVQLVVKKCTSFCSKTRHPPSPPALPIIGHLHLLSSRLPSSLRTLASRYGPLMLIRFGSAPIFVVSDASTAKEILKTHDVAFASKYTLAFGLSKFDIYDGYTFFNAEYGAYWRFTKKLCMTKLFAGTQLDRFIHIREQETLKLLKSLVEKSREGKPCDLGEELSVLSSNIICRMAIGKRCIENPNLPIEIRKLIGDIMKSAAKFSFNEVFGPLSRFDFLGKGKRLVSATCKYDQLMEQLMKKYEEQVELINGCDHEGEKDVMDILMETFKDTNAELKLTRRHIKKFFLEIFFAGVETIAAAMQSAITELIQNPTVFTKLREEIRLNVGSENRLVKESDVPDLPFLQAVVKETLRLSPIGSLRARQCNVDTKINGYDIKAGTRILINGYAIMRDSNTWDKPDEFMPERFLPAKSTDSADHRPALDFKGDQDFHYLPFGSGRRACVGASHGLVVTLSTIGMLVQCFDWKLKDADKIDTKTTGYSGSRALPLACYPTTCFDPTKA
ncbi:CYTOCHROME P450 FAMILY 712 SUBFAMILY A POLYPEPTIDE 2 [Salix purpurea]|uniref:CYTOCHROME P450 FAMILY 712 SUBFAMILY A POLYPEPTIDE 2 n=1 Tax=Salix purpurea TaxID=77065 RepID=A0A9Q0Q4J3_SALPP|nr:CYTOCHROME P450 FAMILY 712 SUBFAMILY A POLYPEPTIDE 2 [Salix purpurea]